MFQPTPRTRARLLAVTALAGLGLAAVPSAAVAAVTERDSASDVNLVSGSKTVRSFWTVSNNAGMGDTRFCDGSLGLGIQDAGREGTTRSRGDAFDNGLVFEVDGQQLQAPATWTVTSQRVGPGDRVDRAVTAGPMDASGLRNAVEYRTLSGSQMLRSTLRVTNPDDSARTVPVTVSTNVGSDGSSIVRGTSNGDTDFAAGDRWVVTSQGTGLDNDPVNIHALSGPGRVLTPVDTTTQSVFDCAGVEGVGSTYDLRVPAGATRSLMFFNRLAPTATKALRMAERFDTSPRPKSALVSDLSDQQRAAVVNWDLR